MSTHLIGDPDMVTEGLRQLQERTGADERMLSTRSHSYENRVRSLSLIAGGLGAGRVGVGRRRPPSGGDFEHANPTGHVTAKVGAARHFGPARPAGDEERVGPGRRCPREAHGRGEHVDVPEGARGVVGEGLTQAVLLVGAGERGVDEAE